MNDDLIESMGLLCRSIDKFLVETDRLAWVTGMKKNTVISAVRT